MRPAPTSQLVTARAVYSTDGGATWSDFSTFHALATNVANGYVTQSPVTAPIDLAVGQSAIFGLRYGDGGETATATDAGCSITVRLESRTGSSTPLDERQRIPQTH